MKQKAITILQGTGVPIIQDDIDTDIIVPARFLIETTFKNMGNHAFYDQRYNPDKTQKDHPLNNKKYSRASILIVGENFGCGSSREHAPQALQRRGINVVIGKSFAEIYAANSVNIGLVNVQAGVENIEELAKYIQDNPQTTITVNLNNEKITYGTNEILLQIDQAQRKAFLSATYNSLDLLLENIPQVKEKRARVPYFNLK